MWSIDPNLTPTEVRDFLTCGADDIGDPVMYGAGRLNAYNSLLSVLYGDCFRPGDLDFDGSVTKADVDRLTHFLTGVPALSPAPPAPSPTCVMDFNIDGVVDQKDVQLLHSFVVSGYPDLVIPVGCF